MLLKLYKTHDNYYCFNTFLNCIIRVHTHFQSYTEYNKLSLDYGLRLVT